MTAYILADVDVHDPETYEAYRKLVPATIEKYGGKFLVRGGAYEVIEGDWQPARMVLLAFEDMARAKAWYESPEYTAAKAIRIRASNGQMLIVDGV